MGKERGADFLTELFRVDTYKPNQGQAARKVTVSVLVAALGLGVWRLIEFLRVVAGGAEIYYGIPILLLVLGLWVCFRVYNYERFAEFLIAVEGEMHKVSWPTWPVLVRASVVVIGLIFLLALSLFCFDIIWRAIFQMFGVVA